ncbi:MAG TPA: hypothetical protein VJY34_04925 [Roseiarcus sp.]|nr:hypothetical protein [Roseiarcus sp.]
MFGLFRNRSSRHSQALAQAATEAAPATAPAPAVEQRDINSDPWATLLGYGGGVSVSGPDVSPLAALSVPAVRAAVESSPA